MTTLEAFELKLPIIKAIPAGQIKMSHNMPIETYVQEAENLHNWCLEDQEALTTVKLSWDLVLDLPVRCGALREAESRWQKKYLNEEAAEKLWKETSPRAYALRNDLLDHFRFAFRHDEKLAKKIRKIAEGRTQADMIQDLNDLSVLGKGQPEYLEAINFDMPLLDKAALWSGEMASLLAVVVGDRAAAGAAKKLRDQAYTHLKEAVDELYGYGQYVFRDSEERRKRYCSEFLQRRRAKTPTTPEPGAAAAPTAPKTDETQTLGTTEQKQS